MPTAESTGKPAKKSALGRGLSALLVDANTAQTHPEGEAPARSEKAGIQEIELASIETNPYQPRTHFDQERLQELADSIKVQGIIQPITVRRLAAGSYQLIAGERRLQASRLIGLERIPAYIRTADDEQMLEMALIENIQREDLNPIEVALAYKRLMDECRLILEDVGSKVGKNRATVNNYLRLLKLPPALQAGLRDGLISMGHARALITVEDPVQQLNLYNSAVQQGLSVRQVEDQVRALSQQKVALPSAKPEAAPAPTPYQLQVQQLQRSLESKFATRVQIQSTAAGAGEIRLKYYSEEDFNRLLELLQ